VRAYGAQRWRIYLNKIVVFFWAVPDIELGDIGREKEGPTLLRHDRIARE
jgi:hypothetical protein